MEEGESQSSDMLGKFRRVDALWFPDGNIVVIAGDAAFRVHQGILSRQSEIFKDVFIMPLPILSDNTVPKEVDGCPVVHVSDTPFDFQQLLHALYDPLRVFERQDVPFVVLAALTRMAHKYNMEDLLSVLIRRLESEYLHLTTRLSLNTIRNPGEALMAVNLFRLIQRENLLVPALYRACQLPTSILLRGETRADGAHEILSAHDQELTVELKRELAKHKALLFFAALVELPMEGLCLQPPTCMAAMLDAQRKYRQQGAQATDSDPLSPAFRAELSRFAGGPLCSVCLVSISIRVVKIQSYIRDTMLPEFIGSFDAKL